MGERRFINPSRIVLSDAVPFFYPISNTPTIDLCEDIPPRESGRPVAVCLLGAGDIRNVLYSTYKQRGRGDQCRLNFYVNDHNPAIVARDILLLTLAAQAPQGDCHRHTEFVDFFVHVYADLFVADDTKSRVDTVLEDLISNFPSEGSALKVSEPDQLWHLKKTWALWLIDQQKVHEVRIVRQTKNKACFLRRQLYDKASSANLGSVGVPGPDTDLSLEAIVSLEAMMNSDLAATPKMREELTQYYKSGNIGGNLHGRLNTTLFDPETKEFPHYSSNPFQPFITTAEAGDYNADNQTLLATLKSSLKRLLSVFSRELKSGNIQVTFDIGDCNSFFSERLPADEAFDVIDTSNLADNLGLINLLVLGIPRLNKDEPHSTLWTETLKAHMGYDTLDGFLIDSLGYPYAVISTMLQTVCTIPFESVYALDDQSGIKSRSTSATGLLLKWKNAFSASNTTPNLLDLAPNPDACIFRQFVDGALSHIYDSYTGSLHDFKGENKKRQAILPREFTFTVSTIMHVLCQAAKMLKRPRQLFDYLYEKVRLKERRTRPVDPGERFFGVFALDVQMTAALTCPDEYKPLEPLHPLLALDRQKSLETRTCALTHSSGRMNHPSPILGWLLLDDYSPLDGVYLQTMLGGLSAKSLGDSPTVSGFSMELLKMARTENVFSYISRNVQRFQFIDSVSVPFPDKEALLTLPSSLFTSNHRYAIVGTSTLDGTIVYSPITDTAMAAATTFSLQTQTLEYVNSDTAESLTESDDSQRVSVLREYPDRVVGIIESKTPLKPTWKLTSEKIGPLEVLLRIYTTPTHKDAVTESREVSMCLPTDVEVNSVPRLLEFIDERKVNFSLLKSQIALYPREEKLKLGALEKWPVNRPLGVGFSMFTATEIAASTGGLAFGHDLYLDARTTIFAMYNAFVDQNMMSCQIMKVREDGKKLFHAISSLNKGFLAYTPELKVTPLGTPVIELHYLDSTDPPPPEVDQFLEYVHSPQRIDDHEMVTTRGTDEEIDFLLDLLRRNARLLEDETRQYVGGVQMKRSFIIPIYPKEDRFFGGHPEQSRSAYMGELDQWRKQQVIPPWITAREGLSHQSPQVHHPVATEGTIVACFTCSSRGHDLKRCSRCQAVWFCNRKCQKAGWKRHKQHCRPGRDAN